MLRVLSTVMLAALLAVPALAVPAVSPAAPDDEPSVFWLRSDGSHGVSLLGAFLDGPGADSVQTCEGIAPIANSCILKDHTTIPYGGSWSAGIFLPRLGGAPAHAFIGSIILNLTGTHTLDRGTWSLVEKPSSVFFGCNFALVSAAGGVAAGDFNCASEFNEIPAGDLTATITAGALDGRYPVYGLPTRNDTPVGVGGWGGVLDAS